MKVKAAQDAGSVVLAGNDTVNQVVTNADYNNKGLLTSADAISTSDYTTLTGTGVWKLSGSYSIGLGGTTLPPASATRLPLTPRCTTSIPMVLSPRSTM